jgi:hypothetical protein
LKREDAPVKEQDGYLDGGDGDSIEEEGGIDKLRIGLGLPSIVARDSVTALVP